ncbi:ATP-binding protein [Geobacter sp. DSM 9736]|uniref:ATP-binding protein n=1 Tax=Geobacter sp. DSM 9736 TaxID=1277350 RepID=UPI000B513C44|nr:ATP-binding protein [Geobacter sp. DSM 9736]SNB46736.1 ATP-dependent DNA helicase RecG [Geobacter sp. DSM 9736]
MDQVLILSERIQLATRIGESHYREFKSAYQGPPTGKIKRPTKDICADIAKTLVAFANADGGELFVGIEDDGTITGLPHSVDEIDQLKNSYVTHVHGHTPLPKPHVSLVQLEDQRVLYFSIGKGNEFAYLTSDGKCLKRLDLESVPVGSERIRAERLELESRTWDRAVDPSASLDDLDFDLLQQVSNQIAYGVTPEKCLQHLGIAEFAPTGMKLKVAALLLFAKDVRKFHPGCFVRIFTVSGKERRSGEAFNVIKDDIVADNVIKLVETAWERLSYALTMHTSLTDHAKFKQSYLYPQIACREALINAIVHRNYAIQGRGIEISIFNDRLEIASPGRILSTISLDDIRKLKGAHESRNPLIARVLREVGYVREMGEGIRRIFDVMRSNALAEPDIQSGDDNFTVTLYHRSLYDPKVKLWLSLFESFKLSESQTAVLALGYEDQEFSTQDIIDRLGILDTDQVREILTPLRQLGLVTRTKTHAQAFNISKSKKLAKRSVPIYKVVANPGIRGRVDHVTVIEDEETMAGTKEINLFVGGLDYSTTKENIVAALDEHCGVLNVDIPTGGLPSGSNNKGYAFVTVEIPDGEITDEFINRIDGLRIGKRKVNVRLRK